MKKQIWFVSLLTAFFVIGCDSRPQKGDVAAKINTSLERVMNPGGIDTEGFRAFEAGEHCYAFDGMKVTVQGVDRDRVLVMYEYDPLLIGSALDENRSSKCPTGTIFFVEKRQFLWW